MKIISGKYKGRNIEGFDIVGTRPTMDRVKESLFATIQNYIDESIVLDLFSGSGNLGLEALSEGAKYAYLVDYNHKAVKTINKNFSGKIIEVGEMQYKIEGLEPDMIFQWDDLFGIVVIYNDNKEEVLDFLRRTVIL